MISYKERVIKIKKYYCYYNNEDENYYLDKSYPYKKDKKCQKYKNHCQDGKLREFKYDERVGDLIIPIPPTPAAPVTVLQVDFDKINVGDRIWLNGIVSLNNNNNTFSTVTLTILRTSPILGTPQVVYTQVFEIDNEGDDDLTQVPFSHVDVPTTQLFDIVYQVRITVGNPNLFVQTPNTLTASRISR